MLCIQWILHGFDDEQCVEILKNCHEAISEDGKLLVVDVVIEKNEGIKRQAGLLFDVAILAGSKGGKERTEEEFKDLFYKAGFKTYKFFKLPFLQTLIEISK